MRESVRPSDRPSRSPALPGGSGGHRGGSAGSGPGFSLVGRGGDLFPTSWEPLGEKGPGAEGRGGRSLDFCSFLFISSFLHTFFFFLILNFSFCSLPVWAIRQFRRCSKCPNSAGDAVASGRFSLRSCGGRQCGAGGGGVAGCRSVPASRSHREPRTAPGAPRPIGSSRPRAPLQSGRSGRVVPLLFVCCFLSIIIILFLFLFWLGVGLIFLRADFFFYFFFNFSLFKFIFIFIVIFFFRRGRNELSD